MSELVKIAIEARDVIQRHKKRPRMYVCARGVHLWLSDGPPACVGGALWVNVRGVALWGCEGNAFWGCVRGLSSGLREEGALLGIREGVSSVYVGGCLVWEKPPMVVVAVQPPAPINRSLHCDAAEQSPPPTLGRISTLLSASMWICNRCQRIFTASLFTYV
jgi:hypothetical protein